MHKIKAFTSCSFYLSQNPEANALKSHNLSNLMHNFFLKKCGSERLTFLGL